MPRAALAALRRDDCWRERGEGGRGNAEGELGIQLLIALPPSAFRPPPSSPSRSLAPAAVLLLVRLDDEAQVGAFFGAGSLALLTLLTLVYWQLRRGTTGPAVALGRGNVLRMALRNAARNPGRSALAIGLTASAMFL